MANKQVVFSDRIVGLSVQNGLVRLDLATIAGPAKNKDGKEGVKLDVTHQLVMPMDAFLAGYNMQQKLVQELLTRQQKRGGKAAKDAGDAAQAPASA